jgi:hypothetical protein
MSPFSQNRSYDSQHNENYISENMPEVITVSLIPPIPENISPLPTLESMTSIMPEEIMMPSV